MEGRGRVVVAVSGRGHATCSHASQSSCGYLIDPHLHQMPPVLLLQVGMATGATIHTANGLKCSVERRVAPPADAAATAAEAALAS